MADAESPASPLQQEVARLCQRVAALEAAQMTQAQRVQHFALLGRLAAGVSHEIRNPNTEVVRLLHIPDEVIEAVAVREQRELDQRAQRFRDGRPTLDVRGCTVILVDDGLATGATMRAAVQALRQQQPAHLVIAVPIAASSTCEELRAAGEEVVCAATPKPFYAVGLWYEDFSQTSDAEVRALLVRSAERHTMAAHGHAAPLQ